MTWKEILDAAPTFIAAAAFFWGVVQYFRAEKEKQETRRMEAKKAFLELQLSLYAEACHYASLIASDAHEGEQEYKSKFYELFWGKLALVEDRDVERAMVQFEQELSGSEDQLSLQQKSLALAHACRNSLAKSWAVDVWQSHYRRDDLTSSLDAGNQLGDGR